MAEVPVEADAAESAERLPQVNEVVRGRGGASYRLLSVLGEGGYGIVFAGLLPDGTGRVAVKTEKFSRSVLHVEAQVLKTAGRARCRRLVELIDYGEVPHHFCFLIMPLLGKNLHDLRNEQRERRFSQRTAVRVAIMTLQGALPWRAMTGKPPLHLLTPRPLADRTAVQAAKLSARTATRAEFLAGCFAEFDPILAHIDALSFSEAPNYVLIIGLLQTAMSTLNCKWDQPLDWEEPTGSNTSDSLQPPPPLRQG
ncbi:Protein kinase domain-containing protein [Aphelenchoides fujianensis]|nr:Protein kinase domain-containing protein [Aphelenchoides fujianensis]